MDSHSPSPPSTPFPAIPPPRKGLSGWGIAGLVGGLLFALVAVTSVFALLLGNLKKSEGNKGQREAQFPPKPPAAEQEKDLVLFAELIASAIENNEPQEINDRTDYDTLTERAFPGTTTAASIKEGFRSQVRRERGGLAVNFLGKRTKVIRYLERKGFPAFTLRHLFDDGGVYYADVMVKPEGGRFKIVEVYNYAYGTYGTDELRQNLLLMHEQDPAVMRKILGLKSYGEKSDSTVFTLLRLQKNKDWKGTIEAFDKLPSEVQRTRAVFIIYLGAVQMLEDDSPSYWYRYGIALDLAREVLDKDSATDLLQVDYYLLKGDYAGVQRCLDRVKQAVGEDAYLFYLQGTIAINEAKYEEAARHLEAAERVEPELRELVDLRMQVRASQKDYAGVVKELVRFTKEQNVTLTPDIFEGAVYDGFRQSPEFAAWVRSLKQ